MLFDDLLANTVISFHDTCNADANWVGDEARHKDGVWRYLELNHRCNTLLWAEEDLARRVNVGDSEIARNKRAIDRFNQQRNDATEKLDELILERVTHVTAASHARLHSETAAAMIDRLSILSLKIFHMRLQTTRADATADHLQLCAGKAERLIAQREDLMTCLDALLSEIARGDAYYKIYRQFKMYNDPSLNPYLQKQAK